MEVDITPIINVILYVIEALIGLDFLWCGYWYIRTRDTERLPRLLGYMALKLFERANRIHKPTDRSLDRIYTNMFSMQAAVKYMLISGIYLVIEGTYWLLARLPK